MRSLKSVSTKLPDDPAKARVAIAKDVIAQIHAKRLRVRTGVYISDPKGKWRLDTLDDIYSRCDVCAKGAVMLSALRKFDGELVLEVAGTVCAYEGLGRRDVLDVMDGVFERAQFDLIECAFEQSRWFGDGLGVDDAVRFGRDHRNRNDRLLAIMQNIVDHGGEFKPEVRYEVTVAE